MNTDLQKEIIRVRELYSADELRDIFARHTYDDHFEYVGRMVVVDEWREPSVYVRKGFEVLVRGN
jgi:hypothetical protein